MPEQKAQDEKKKKKKWIIIISIIAFLLIAIIILLLLLLLKKEEPTEETRGSVRVVKDEESAENVMEDMREEVAKGMFECQMAMTWDFDTWDSASKNAYVANSTNNTYPIYFDVYLESGDGSKNVIYSSPVLPVGAYINNFALDQELPAGTYEATVMYTLLEDETTQKEISSAGFIVTLNILN
jgi:hypothetical protein